MEERSSHLCFFTCLFLHTCSLSRHCFFCHINYIAKPSWFTTNRFCIGYSFSTEPRSLLPWTGLVKISAYLVHLVQYLHTWQFSKQFKSFHIYRGCCVFFLNVYCCLGFCYLPLIATDRLLEGSFLSKDNFVLPMPFFFRMFFCTILSFPSLWQCQNIVSEHCD